MNEDKIYISQYPEIISMAEIHVYEHITKKKHFIEQILEREEEQIHHKIKRFISESREFKGFLVFLLIAALSLTLFNYFEGKGLFKSLYWLITTVTTVGYGDNVPTKNASIIVTMITMILGIGMLGFLATQMTEKIVSTNVQGVFGLKRAKGKKQYIIAGWNNTAEAVLKEFIKENKSVVVVDNKPNPGLAHYENVTFILGTPLDKHILLKANVKETETMVLCMDDDSDVLLAIHITKELNPKINIVAKIDNQEFISIAKRAGADHIVSPSSIGGRLLSIAVDQPSIVQWVMEATTYSTKNGIELIEYDVKKGSDIIKKELRRVKEKIGHKAIIIGVMNEEKGLDTLPEDNYKIQEGDTIVMVVNPAKHAHVKL